MLGFEMQEGGEDAGAAFAAVPTLLLDLDHSGLPPPHPPGYILPYPVLPSPTSLTLDRSLIPIDGTAPAPVEVSLPIALASMWLQWALLHSCDQKCVCSTNRDQIWIGL